MEARTRKLSKPIYFLPHSLWRDLLLYVDVSFFSSPYFGFLSFSTHGRRWPPKPRNLLEFQILGREDLIGPFWVQWLPLTLSVKARKSRWSTTKSPGIYPWGWESGDSSHRRGFMDESDAPPPSVWYKNFWRLATFPLSALMVVHLCFWPFSPQYPPPSLSTNISHWQPQSRNWVKCFLGTHQWDLATSEGLLPRYEHASFVPSCTPHSIWVFGGADQSGNRNCLQVLNPGK